MMILAVNATQINGIGYAFFASDTFGKLVVIALIVASVFAWTIMLNKIIALHKNGAFSDKFNDAFAKNKRSITVFSASTVNNPGSIPRIYNCGIEKLQEFYLINQEKAIKNGEETVLTLDNNSSSDYVSAEQILAIEAALENQVAIEVVELEYSVGVLATLVSVCPFIGLFGTVWGVMMAFVGMAQAGSADIGAMAPGISSALLTTVVGLFVAIPSVVGYNYITGSIRKKVIDMDNFTEAFIAKIKLEQASK